MYIFRRCIKTKSKKSLCYTVEQIKRKMLLGNVLQRKMLYADDKEIKSRYVIKLSQSNLHYTI